MIIIKKFQYTTFKHFLIFLNLGTACPKAGKAAYSDAVRTSSNFSIGANDFFAFHTVLKSSEDYYEAMRYYHSIRITYDIILQGDQRALLSKMLLGKNVFKELKMCIYMSKKRNGFVNQ